jgi:hypothetical protein
MSYDRNKRNLMRSFGTWWEQKVLMGYWWEQEEFDENCLETWGKSKAPPPHLQNKKHPLGACWLRPIGSPSMFYPKVVFRDKLLGEVLPMYGIVFNKLMDQLKRTMLYMCTFYLPASPSASGFQGAGKQNPGSSQSCVRPICVHSLTFSSHYGWPLSTLIYYLHPFSWNYYISPLASYVFLLPLTPDKPKMAFLDC